MDSVLFWPWLIKTAATPEAEITTMALEAKMKTQIKSSSKITISMNKHAKIEVPFFSIVKSSILNSVFTVEYSFVMISLKVNQR